MNFAKFYLQNETGERKSLCVDSPITLVKPEGLGIELSQTCVDLDDGFFSVSDESTPQNPITADLMFRETAYETYRDFINWISEAKELFFVYSPYGSAEFYRRVVVTYLKKTVRGKGGWLSAGVSFKPLTPWYLPTAPRISLTKQTETAMRYPFTYNADLRYGTSSIGSYAADIAPDGHLPASLRFMYKGAAKNPVITLTGAASGKIYGRCIIDAVLSDNDTIELFSSPRDGYIRKIAADGTETDLIDSNAVDITEDPFLRIPLEESCHLQLTADEALSGSAEVQVYYYYRSV